MDFSNLPIEDDISECDKYSSVVERYYTPRYCINVTKPKDDYCILLHSNRVCLVTLAPSHYLYTASDVVSVNFQVTQDVNRLKNKTSGKWKHGAQRLLPQSPIMLVNCANGDTHTIHSGISGKLLEVNKQLLENPKLLFSEPQGKGFVAIVMPEIQTVQQYRDNYLSEEQYKKKCKELYETNGTS